MQLKTIDGQGNISLEDYSDRECYWIFIERNSYVLQCVHSWGEDYGGSQHDEGCKERYEEIIPERILVKDGHFAGVLILTEYEYYNGGGKTFYKENVLPVNGGESARSGSSFSNDDHDRWNYTDYYLVKRPEEK